MKEPSPELAHAVAARDQGCRWKNCDHPVGWCDIHHVREWNKHFGPTAIANLVLLCDRHHTAMHRNGWVAVLHADGDFEVTNPWGETRRTHPPGRLRQHLPPPPGATDDESPWERHRDDFAAHLAARQRIDALIETAKHGRAIASLALLTHRAG